MNPDPDPRRKQAYDWALEQTGWPEARFETASADASFRRYFRISRGGQSRIVMDAPPERESLDSFIDVAGRLSRAGLHVPAIHAADRPRGFLLLDDLGDRPWHRQLDDANADAMFADAIEALIRMQSQADPAGLPEYDAALLLRELELFPDWFLARHWQVEPTEAELDDWEMLCMTLIRWALDQPKVFVHRDFMPRNLMLTEPNPGILDFQDAVLGPISYDPVCLFRDAFLSWPPERVDRWLEDYRQRALAAGLEVPEDPDLWRRTCDLMGTQRHLKVLGIFARIRYRDGKPHYLEDAPRFFSYLNQAIARNPELAPLDSLLRAWQARAQ
ncbi:MAG: aminoglycoside phosphotransferase family protein [Wenzhouxiangellaceae bacterium]